MFKGQPKGLFALALANTGERFGYYTMLAIFVLFIQAKFGFTASQAGQVYGSFLAAVYFMPFIGGILADKFGFGKCVTIGIVVMFLGYSMLSIPTSPSLLGKILMFGALAFVSIGTGLFKGNLQVMVGNLYDDPRYSHKRDSAFSLFYMAINIGAMFAPSAATAITNWHLGKYGLKYYGEIPNLAHQFLDGTIKPEGTEALMRFSNEMGQSANLTDFCNMYLEKLSTAYNMGFTIACASLVLSMAIYLIFRYTFKHTESPTKHEVATSCATKPVVQELTKQQTKNRIFALILVFAVVIFFWMAFHQNGLTLTYFARDYTDSMVTGWERLGFNIWILAMIAISIYTLIGAFQAEKTSNKAILGVITLALWGGSYSIYTSLDPQMNILPQQFQQFNPFFVVALTPISMLLFSWLGSLGKEPSAPKKIAMGMFIAGGGFLIMMLASSHLLMPQTPDGGTVGVNVLMSTYLVLTFGELLLSPMGISFVSKVAPPKYKGMMMGGWFAATAIGNYLTFIPALLWDKIQLWQIWGVLMTLCVIAGLFMIIMMGKLEKAVAD